MRDGRGQLSFRRHLPGRFRFAILTVTARANNLGNLSLAHGREGKCIQQPLEPLVRMN